MRGLSGPLLVALAAVAIPTPGQAELEDFTFRRVKVGDSAPGKRITVQIDPAEQARRLAATAWKDPALRRDEDQPQSPAGTAEGADGAVPGAGPKSNYAWYWEMVAPDRASSAGQFPKAMAALTQGPGGASVAAPRMQSMQTMAEIYGRDILTATVGTDVSPALVLAVIGIESAGRKEAVSSAGAVGLMQLIPATAERFGVTDSTDPAQNIKGGVAYLDWLLDEFDNDPLMALAAYNAGEGAVKKNGGVPPYAETRDYVPKVLAAWQVAQGLCMTPPELVTDPCVFRIMASTGG
ncbi:lytic transglycosylase domain-containing protein [Xinfangfangia sp. D13-10-4-6]|uniref:lytic transglycosylase domain-containing protein n=1 Tax=Pseudogemmobacter hezensis TaxID=2737662 RepID=UPI0015537F53|nr:lytic transglycosylase domain-containing protein [Pseudogemmobacter hezensis]NPD15290.1 lytic transglycosylase domain-containing protein [Pseudogemmobacter hezensis]